MLGPYTANKNGTVSYKGNKIFQKIENIADKNPSIKEMEERVNQIRNNKMWSHISKINHQIYLTSNEYFNEIGAKFILLPLTTRMISSPGAVYGKEKINYTTDTYPIEVKWFKLPKKAFLAESAQIYLEIALTQPRIKQVYSIYNSFRQEISDSTHLSEFHHIEYEGKINQKENEKIILKLIKRIIKNLIKKNYEDLFYFLGKEKIHNLNSFSNQIMNVPRITYKKALEILYSETKNDKYKKFTLKNFGFWEEVKLTEILKNMVIIKEFPLLEVPFYHTIIDKKEPKVADNADIIWPGYREIIGSGHRVKSEKELKEKARVFNLPKKDYAPYMQTRKFKDYKETSGFGMGWERFLQGLLEMPYIWNVSHFPRMDKLLKP